MISAERTHRPIHSRNLLVGRAHERGRLSEALAALLANRGNLILISGETGSGKTALTQILAHEATEQGVLVIQGQVYHEPEARPYGLWHDLFAHWPEQPADGRHLDTTPASFTDRIPLPNFEGYNASADKFAIAAQLHNFFATTVNGPLCIILEELQWADAASLELLRQLTHRLATKPIVLVATYRDEGIARQHPLYGILPVLTRETDPIRLRLAPLDDSAVQTLIWTRYGLPPHDETRLLTMLSKRGEGNPLFITELLRTCEETGVLRRTQASDRDMQLGNLDELAIPPIVQQILDTQLAPLGTETIRLLAIAAILGHEVDLELWGEVAGLEEEALLELVERTMATGIIRERPDGSAITFCHTLMREALYTSLSAPRRRLLHRRIGELLAARAQEHPGGNPTAIATHFAQSGDPRATTWLIHAGDYAVQGRDWLAALDYHARAEQLLRASNTDEATRGWLLYRLGRLHRYSDTAASLAMFAQAEQIARATNDRTLTAIVSFGRALLRVNQGQLHRGITELEGALCAWDSFTPQELSTLQQYEVGLGAQPPYGSLALLLAQVGRFEEAMTLAQPIVETTPLPPTNRLEEYPWGDAWLAIGIARGFMGMPSVARAAFARARLAYQSASLHDLAGYSAAAELDVVLNFTTDDLAARLSLAAEAEEENAQAQGMPFTPATKTTPLPLLLLEGRWAECRALAEDAHHSRYNPQLPASVVLGKMAQWQGDITAAWQIVAQEMPAGLATPMGGTGFSGTLSVISLAIDLALDAGDLPTARAWLEVQDRWLRWGNSVAGVAEGQLRWARFYLRTGKGGRARTCGEAALKTARAPRQPLVILRCERFMGEIETLNCAFESAAPHFETALALAEACAAPYERALTLLAVAEFHLAIASANSDERHQTTQPAAVHTAKLALDEARAIGRPLKAVPMLTRLDIIGARLHTLEPRHSASTIPDTAPQKVAVVAPWSPSEVPLVAPMPGLVVAAGKLPSGPPPAGLTVREIEVLRLIAAGLSNREIATRLYLSVRTAERHIANIYKKIKAHSKADATAFAFNSGLL